VPTLVVGQVVENKYRVVRALAAGGFGAVYEVFREGLKQRGAMKVLTLNPSPEMVQRIHNEARVLGALRHPNIPQIYDMGSFPDGAPWLVMEFLEGESLEARLIRSLKSGQRGLPFADVMEIGEDITAAMTAAHEKGVIHRDMKPSNVVLVPDAKASCGLRAVVLDFGIARMAGDGLTQTGALLGTEQDLFDLPSVRLVATRVSGVPFGRQKCAPGWHADPSDPPSTHQRCAAMD
jgi:serine/threonine-protein kinase